MIAELRVHSQLDSVQIFLAFAQRYRSMVGRKFHIISEPKLPLTSYLKDVTSFDYRWLTHLTLLNVTVPRTALIQVSLITNLAVLTVGPNLFAPDIGVDDSLIRTWSRVAATGSFCMLRVLALREQTYVTARVFDYLKCFPALAIFATESVPNVGPSDDNVALAFGWKCRIGKDLRTWIARGHGVNDARWDETLQTFFELAKQSGLETLTDKDIDSPEALPVMLVAVGGCPKNAAVDVTGEGRMCVWYRHGNVAVSKGTNVVQTALPGCNDNNIRDHHQHSSAPVIQDIFTQKRPSDAIGNIQPRKKNPASRTILEGTGYRRNASEIWHLKRPWLNALSILTMTISM